jgi:feruloyl-CoA synthase
VFGERAEQHDGAIALARLLDGNETVAVMRTFATIAPSATAKLLLTSGSTGAPKVVLNSHAMLTANQQQMTQVWPWLQRHPLHLLDWLPWSHTFGANHNFNMVLAHGGSLTIDEGRPTPGLIEKTVRNLREVKPNFYFNVPRGFDMLLPYLEQTPRRARLLERSRACSRCRRRRAWESGSRRARAARAPAWFTSPGAPPKPHRR